MFWPRSLLFVAVAASASAQGHVSIRVLLGASDTESTSWDGGVRAQGASIVSIEPWRFEGADAIDGHHWRLSKSAGSWPCSKVSFHSPSVNLLKSSTRISLRMGSFRWRFTLRQFFLRS